MDNIGLMSETVNFIQGSKKNYDSSTMQGGVYFSKDSKEILLNGESYGNAVPADEEDLTSVNGALQLKDREVNADNFQSKGYVILRKNIVDGKNILTQEMINQPNTIYEIRYDFNLNGQEITIPDGCVLKFEGGEMKNGDVTFNNTSLQSPLSYIFNTINVGGTVLGTIPVEYFGCFPNQPESIDLATSLKQVYSISSTAKLRAGRYYTKESSIEVKNLIGSGKSATIIEFSNIKSANPAFRFGKTTGGPENRTWNNYISDLQVEIKNNGATQTSAIEINNATRAVLERITLINYNVRNSEYSGEELTNPELYSNYALVTNGASELIDISNYTFIADIPIYTKRNCDLLSLRKGYLECSEFGFAGIYGVPLGTNSEISGGLDIARGLYGMHFTPNYSDSFRTNYSNIRIEQLRAGGANIYVNAADNVLSFIISNLSLSTNTKGFKIEGDSPCRIFLQNIICFDSDTYDLFDISNPRTIIYGSKFNMNKVKKFKDVSGAKISQDNLYTLPDPFVISTSNPPEVNYSINTLTVRNDVITISRPMKESNSSYIASVLYSKLFTQDSIILNINVYDRGVAATLKALIRIEDDKFSSISIIEDRFNLSRYLGLKINVDYYLDLYVTGIDSIFYDFSGIAFNSTDKLSLINYYKTDGISSDRPSLSSSDYGFEYFDTTLNKQIIWNGTEWTNLDGTSLDNPVNEWTTIE